MRCEISFPARGDKRGPLRFSNPLELLVAHSLEQVLPVLARAGAAAAAGRWAVGLVSYEAAPACDRALRVRAPDGRLPLAVFAVFDAPVRDTAKAHGNHDYRCGRWEPEIDRGRFRDDLARIARGIADGEHYQVNYTARWRSPFAGDAHAFFDALRAAQPEAYCAYLDAGDWQLLSASPELFFEWTPDRQLTTRPMKGTAARSGDPQRDAFAAQSLSVSAKERAENLMIVDLLRNDLSRIAETGTVKVPQLFAIEALPTAWQMTSTITCRTRPEITLADIFRALFPCGSVTGAPKIAAMARIAELEDSPRGPYCGAIGVLRPGGHAVFSVGIRGVVIDARTDRAECGIGSGVTADSRADDEYAEWLVKRRFLLRASADFEMLETLRLEQGAIWLRAGHLRRLQAGAEHFGLRLDARRIDAALDELCERHAHGAWRVRLLLARDGCVTTECAALDALPDQPRVALAMGPVDSSDEFLRYKTTQRSIYAAHAPRDKEIFDTLLFNERNELTEFTKGNLVVELDGRRLTPPVGCGLLPGVLREELLAKEEIEEGVIRIEDLGRATGLWFINSVRGMLPVSLSS